MIGKFSTIGPEEEEAVLRVIRGGNLSGYVASRVGAGPEVEALSGEWEDLFGKFSVPCNSATSGLLAACMAVGVKPGHEVIVPYFSMSATAAAPATLGATVVFANVEPDTLCIDPADVGRLITENTRAVIATNLFGHPAKLKMLRQMCDAAGIWLIEDNAQGYMAKEDGKFCGTIGHIGVFSLNVHKHIQAGEGGVCCTDTMQFYHALNDAVNHGEVRGSNIIGLNLRMTELTAAVARAQLKKLPAIVESRRMIANGLRDAFSYVPGHYRIPDVRIDCEHAYYAFPIFNENDVPIHYKVNWLRERSQIPISIGYNGNLLQITTYMNQFATEHWRTITASESYKQIHDMMLIETCSYDIQPHHIETLADRLRRAGK